MAPTLTPTRSPMPTHLRRKAFAGQTIKRKGSNAAAASSSEKETPTVVFTETCSPFPNKDSGDKTTVTGTSGGMLARSTTVAPMTARRSEKLFQSQNSTSSSPGSRAGQSLVDEDGEAGASQAFSSAKDSDNNYEENLSEDSDTAKHNQVVGMIQNVLSTGIASICRLRQLFPPSFFQKYDFDFDGTTITRFNEDAIKKVIDTGDDAESRHSDDDDSMVKSFQTRTQQPLSALTEMSQKHHGSRNKVDRIVHSDREKQLAMEALLLMRWMENEGVGEILKEGNLAKVVFGINVPSDESADDESKDEVVESYSFNISYNQPENPSEVDRSEVIAGTGSFFQNLNGFRGQSLVPSKTQSSLFSQASRASSHYDTQTQNHFSLSQKHHDSQSQTQQMMEMSQKSLMASMSQSIGVSVKKNRGQKIPANRYLTLRVDFAKQVAPDELPAALKQKYHDSATSLTSPVPHTGGNAGKSATHGFVVTPLGRIAEMGYSGLCVDMVAETKVECEQDDEKSVHFTQHSHSSSSTEGVSKPFTQPIEEYHPADEEEEESKMGHFPLTQPAENENESCIDTVDSREKERPNTQHTTNEKENMEIVVGGKAFGIPFGKGRQKYLLCDVRDHRSGKREEYKCAFYSKKLEALGRKKQWILSSKVIAYDSMIRNVETALGSYSNDQNGGAARRIIEEVAQKVRVDSEFVEKIARKRKTTLNTNCNKSIKKSRT